MKWLENNWFKIVIVIILVWFGYAYIRTLEFNEFVECNLFVQSHWTDSLDKQMAIGNLCGVATAHKTQGNWLIPQ